MYLKSLRSLTLKYLPMDDQMFNGLVPSTRRLDSHALSLIDKDQKFKTIDYKRIDIKDCPGLININLETPELKRFRSCLNESDWDLLLPSIWTKNPPRSKSRAYLLVCSSRQVVPGWSCNELREFLARSSETFKSLYVWECGVREMPQEIDLSDVNGLLLTPHPTTIAVLAEVETVTGSNHGRLIGANKTQYGAKDEADAHG
ncbi:hypothetical protein CRG98_035370 [Punica granatum]|uniref:Uncharacterized protein n=1 Tax=Punica granatum TaxID=22663 RepID=A0A2I0ILR1_PUNGR|nr:hypothetical protein CRG98_035370 [Punica granatum]